MADVVTGASPGAQSDQGQPPPAGAWAGPWASDAQRLLRMLSDAGDQPGGAHGENSHASAAECRHCPLCQGMALIRRSGPDILDRVAELATGLAATLRSQAGEPRAEADPPPPGGGAHEPGLTDDGPGRDAAPRPVIAPIVRIDITD